VRLTVIGCSGSVPGPYSAASSYLLEHDGFQLVVDLGHGALGSLQRFIGVGAVDAVAISHLHADHWIDLLALDVARAYGPYDVFSQLPVFAPAALEERFAMAGGYGAAPVKRTTFDFRVLPDTDRIGPFDIQTTKVAHPGEAFAIRFEVDGASLVFSGDTGPCDALRGLATGADVLLIEAAAVEGQDNPPNLHLTGGEAGEVGSAAGVGRLVLTHIPPWNSTHEALEDARRTYSGEVTLASPGLVVEVTR
jgi:ribonuclease BN (tRNA processing enzyme)